MEFNFVEQSVVYSHQNDEKYAKGIKKRTLKNVKEDATPAELKQVGEALTTLLDGDKFMGVEVLECKSFNLFD